LFDPLIRVERISRQIGKTIAYKNLPEADYAAAPKRTAHKGKAKPLQRAQEVQEILCR